MKNLSQLSNKELYQLCQKYGENARKWQKKFAALLPEVAKRQLYRKYKFYSIYEFALLSYRQKLEKQRKQTVTLGEALKSLLENEQVRGRQYEISGIASG